MNKKLERCQEFFKKLCKALDKTHAKQASCNVDLSAYLIPKGTGHLVTYYGKPENSFRISDHWNWYSNIKKCSIPDEVQCWSVDLQDPLPRDPENPDLATMGRKAYQVAYYGKDKKYHCVYGERYNSITGEYEWVETSPEWIADMFYKGRLDNWTNAT